MKRHAVIAVICGVAAGAPAMAQDRVNGEKLAKAKCAVCHIVDEEGPASGERQAAPTFSSIAQRPKVTRAFLDSWLSGPHPGHGMPNFFLTYTEVRDVSAYILSLRKPGGQRNAGH